MVLIPQDFSNRTILVHGENGRRWLAELPDNILWAEQHWKFAVLAPFALSYNFVVPVIFQNGTQGVLKVCVSNEEYRNEKDTLQYYNGVSMCKLLDYDADRKMLLLQMLRPGDNLTSVNDESTAVRIAILLIKAMKGTNGRPLLSFPQISDWARGIANLRKHYQGASGPFQEMTVRKVECLFPELIATQQNTYLLHGDFHHGNILSSSNDWKLIDPKGIVGEMEYELIPFLLNNLPNIGWDQVIDHRILLFKQQLDINTDRAYGWGLCHSLLSTWWNIEDRLAVSDRDLTIVRHFYAKLG